MSTSNNPLSESFSVLNIQDYNTITMLVKKPYPGRVALELQSPTGGSGMIYADYLATDNSWQKLTFPVQNVSGLGETGLTKVLIEIHREKENDNPDFEDCIMYADELVLHKAVPGFGFNGEDFITGCWLPFPSDEFSKRAMIVDNPDKSGINTTDRCLWISREKNDETFAGAINRNLRVLDLGNYEYFKMLVKKSIAGPVALEIQSPGEVQKQVLTADYTNAGEWQELHFDIPEGVLAGEPLQIIILQAHAVDTKEDASFTDPIDVYVDELYLVGDGSSISMTEFDEARIVRTDAAAADAASTILRTPRWYSPWRVRMRTPSRPHPDGRRHRALLPPPFRTTDREKASPGNCCSRAHRDRCRV